MEQSKITLNVMPWFRQGTHERFFNALMHYSCPVTDESSWLREHFEQDKECTFYSLEHLNELPDKIYRLLTYPELQKEIIEKGREKVENNYTSKQNAGMMLKYLEKCYQVK